MNPVLLALAIVIQGSNSSSDIPAKYLHPHPNGDTVAASVNGVDIKASELDQLVWEWRGGEASAEVINYILVKQEAEKNSIYVGEKDVEAKMAEYKTNLQKWMREHSVNGTLDDYMASLGFTDSRLYLDCKRDLMLENMADREFKVADYVQVKTIMFPVKTSDAAELGAAVNKAQNAYERLKKGESWSSVLQATTTDQAVIKSDGLLDSNGWRPISAFPETVSSELTSLKKGDVTKPAQTQVGIQIFKILAKGDTATAQEADQLRSIFRSAKIAEIQARLRKNAKIQLYRPGGKL